ncbi:MAG: nucleotidyltransferase family protein [Lachnospiraceae bacterium]
MKKKITLVLLAAGDSRRFGGNKLLSNFHGMPMYRHLVTQIETIPETLFCQKILVTQYPEIASDLENYGYETVINTQSTIGISHSIHLALDHLHDQADAICFAVCDQPWLQGKTIEAFLSAWLLSNKGIGCLSHQQRLGNPAVFTRIYIPELYSLTGDIGGKKILKRHIEDTYLYNVQDKKELLDIDKNTCHNDTD